MAQRSAVIDQWPTRLPSHVSGPSISCSGAGRITVYGKFFERNAPGISGAEQLVVSEGGAVVSTVAQGESPTQFAFERGCQLRVKIIKPDDTKGASK